MSDLALVLGEFAVKATLIPMTLCLAWQIFGEVSR